MFHKLTAKAATAASQFKSRQHGSAGGGMAEVQLRWTSVDHYTASALHALELLLSADELGHVAAARDETARKSRLLGRALLRRELCKLTGLPATSLPLQKTAEGKLFLSIPAGQRWWFSVSYSGGLILHAFSQAVELGVDLERVEARHVTRQLLEEMVSERERKALSSLGEDDRAQRFFEIWTARESLLKATGLGLSGMSDTLKDDFNQCCFLGACWQTGILPAPAGFKAAISWKGTDQLVLCDLSRSAEYTEHRP